MSMKLFWKGSAALALIVILTGRPAESEDAPAPAPKEYTVSFEAGDGTGTAPGVMKAKEGDKITLPKKGDLTAPEKKVFECWKASGDTVLPDGSAYTVTKDITFTAQWKTEGTEPPPPNPLVGVWIDEKEKTHISSTPTPAKPMPLPTAALSSVRGPMSTT